jgi:hypothetical protein
MTRRSRRLQNMCPDEHVDGPAPPPSNREAVTTSLAPMLAAGTVVLFPPKVVLRVLPLRGSPAPVRYIYDAAPDAEGGLLAATLAFFSHQGHQVFHNPCPDLEAYRRTRGVVSSIVPVDRLPDHILSSGWELLEGLFDLSPPTWRRHLWRRTLHLPLRRPLRTILAFARWRWAMVPHPALARLWGVPGSMCRPLLQPWGVQASLGEHPIRLWSSLAVGQIPPMGSWPPVTSIPTRAFLRQWVVLATARVYPV